LQTGNFAVQTGNFAVKLEIFQLNWNIPAKTANLTIKSQNLSYQRPVLLEKGLWVHLGKGESDVYHLKPPESASAASSG
jgi:hypothetical protein